MKFVLAALVCLVTVVVSKAEKGYLLTAPKVLDAGSSERLCLILTDVSGEGQVNVKLLQTKVDIVIAETTITFPRNDTCFFLAIPNVKYSEGRIQVKGEFKDDDYSFESETKVAITTRSAITFIQTDKAIYKPSQKVQFRILTVNYLLEPVSGVISKVFIQNPNGIRVAQWLNVSNSNGLVQLDMQLSEEPALGFWKINAEVHGQTKSQKFEVGEYVLPDFSVTITPPKYLLANAESATWKVCARYSYGKGVQGKMKFEIKYKTYRWDSKDYPSSKVEEKINGCYDVTVYVNTMKWNDKATRYRELEVTAEVEEDGTGVMYNAEHKMQIGFSPFEMKFKSKEDHKNLKPGLPFFGQIYVSKPDMTPAGDETIEVCYRSSKERHSSSDTSLCKNYTSSPDGLVDYVVPPQKPEILVSIDAKGAKYPPNYAGKENQSKLRLRQPFISHSLTPWYSPSGSFLDIEPIVETISCDKKVPLNIRYTTDGGNITVHYQVMSRGRIVAHGTKTHSYVDGEYKENDSYITQDEARVKRQTNFKETVNYTLPAHIGQFTLDLDITPDMAPTARVLLFYIRPDNEAVAAHTFFDVKPCFNNKATLKFKESSIYPGTNAKYEISAAPNSICAVAGVDKKVHILRSDNQLTSDKVFNVLKGFDAGRNTNPVLVNNQEYCKKKLAGKLPTEAPTTTTTTKDQLNIRPPWYGDSYSYSSNYVDALTSFDVNGQAVSSNLRLESRPCQRYIIYSRGPVMNMPIPRPMPRPRPVPRPRPAPTAPQPISASSGASGNTIPEESGVNDAVEIREYFPETWLWDLEVIGKDGTLEKESEIPHSITEWVGSMFCTSADKGLGVSPSAYIKAFQPFFASFSLPYSVVRKEKVPILVSVFNYLSGCIPVKLTLEQSDFYDISGDRTHKMCVCSKPGVHSFKISPTGLGEVNLTVYAHAFNDAKQEICGKDKTVSTVDARDTVINPLIVEPEGFPQEVTQSVLFCPSEHPGGFNHSFELSLPDDLVPGSERAYLSISGDIMGPSLSGLEKLVALPTGCGEQNMILFAPNIFVMQYLKGTSSLTDEIEKKSLQYMKIGYQRELNYRHSDGSYSAFGESDKEGSSWLTAFVIKSFAQANEFIEIDPVDLKKSTDWLLSKQQTDGCFPFIGMVHHKDMKGGVGKGVPTALTAYIMISLLESKTPMSQEKIDKAFNCIAKQSDPNSYTLGLTAYAAVLAGKTDLANELLNKLYSRAINEGTSTYWKTASKSVSVELGAYVILTLNKLKTTENQAKALNIVRWVARQRNANGGFVSTQDTVIALQAFAEYAIYQSKATQNLKVTAEGGEFTHNYNITKTNRLLMQTDKIENLETEFSNIIEVMATGEGCGLAQATLKYNKANIKPEQALSLSVEGIAHDWDCKKRTIKVCASYNIPGENSNMALVTVKMVSGYIPDKKSLKNLKYTIDDFKRYEVDKNFVNIYFDYLNQTTPCFKFDVIKEIDVEDAKPATVTVFDYYVTELKLEASYELPEVKCVVRPPHIEPLGPFVPIDPIDPIDPLVLDEDEPEAVNATKSVILPEVIV